MIPTWENCLILPDPLDKTDPAAAAAKRMGYDMGKAGERESWKQQKGTIIACGGNCFSGWLPPVPKKGDRVVYNMNAGFTIDIDGVEHRLIADRDVNLIMEKDDE